MGGCIGLDWIGLDCDCRRSSRIKSRVVGSTRSPKVGCLGLKRCLSRVWVSAGHAPSGLRSSAPLRGWGRSRQSRAEQNGTEQRLNRPAHTGQSRGQEKKKRKKRKKKKSTSRANEENKELEGGRVQAKAKTRPGR